jgi:hypothetical protein
MLSQAITRSIPFLLITFLWSCSHSEERIDIEGHNVVLEWVRLDQELFHADVGELAQKSLFLQEQIGPFYRLYVEELLRLAPLDSPRLPAMLLGFISDPDWKEAQDEIDTVFGDMSKENREMTEAFARLHVLFPDAVIPKVVLFNSGFNYGIVPLDSVLGIGGEWFIGSDKAVIDYLAAESFPNYLKARMNPEMLVPSAMKGWLLTHYGKDMAGKDLLAHLVERGKVLVLLDALLPDTPEYLQLAFTPEQMEWCEQREFTMWQELIKAEVLFSKSGEDIGRFMNDGPFTNGFPRESPGHVGEYIGKRIVQSYWDSHSGLSLKELMEIDRSELFLKTYKPR